MKKLIIIFMILLVITGCGKKKELVDTMSCTYQGKKENNKFSNVVDITIKNDEVTESILNSTYEEEEAANNICKIYKMANDGTEITCDGKTISIKGFHKTINESEQVTKNEITEYLENQGYTCK